MTLGGLRQKLGHQQNAIIGTLELACKKYASANLITDADWEPLGILQPGSFTFEQGIEEYNFMAGLPVVPQSANQKKLTAGYTAKLSGLNAELLEQSEGGYLLDLYYPDRQHHVVTDAGNSTTQAKLNDVSGLAQGTVVSFRRAAGTTWEKRTLNSVDTGTKIVTWTGALGGAPAANDKVRKGITQDLASIAGKVATVDDGTDFSEAAYILMLDNSVTTTFTGGTADAPTVASATGFAEGKKILVRDVSTGLLTIQLINQINGTTFYLFPGLTFDPANGDEVTLCELARVKSKSGNDLTLDRTPVIAFVADDDFILIEGSAQLTGGSVLGEYSSRALMSSDDNMTQIVLFLPRHTMEATETIARGEPTGVNLKAVAEDYSTTVNGAAVNAMSEVWFLYEEGRLTA